MLKYSLLLFFIGCLGFSQNVYKIDYGVEYLNYSVDTLEVDPAVKSYLIQNENDSKKFLSSSRTLFELYFDRNKSVFINVEVMETDDQSKSVTLLSKVSEYAYSAKKQQLFSKNDSRFIQIEPHIQNWEIIEETKNILGYRCKKAIIKDYSKSKPKITAWFTEEIPMPYGPVNFYGLPGIILELNRYDRRIYALEVMQTDINSISDILKKKRLKIIEK